MQGKDYLQTFYECLGPIQTAFLTPLELKLVNHCSQFFFRSFQEIEKQTFLTVRIQRQKSAGLDMALFLPCQAYSTFH